MFVFGYWVVLILFLLTSGSLCYVCQVQVFYWTRPSMNNFLLQFCVVAEVSVLEASSIKLAPVYAIPARCWVLVELFGSGWGDHILWCGLVGAVFTLSSNFPMLSITLRNNFDTLFQLLLRKGMMRGGSIESLVISVSFYAAISWLFLVKSLVTFINRGDFLLWHLLDVMFLLLNVTIIWTDTVWINGNLDGTFLQQGMLHTLRL